MEATTSVLLHSRTAPFGFAVTNCQRKFSLRHFNKQLLNHRPTLKPTIRTPSSSNFYQKRARPHLLLSVNCSYSDATSPDSSQDRLLKPLKNLNIESLKTALFKLTPFNVIKWFAVLSVAIAATKWSLKWVLNPFFWMYFSWTWLFWPWFVAVGLAVYGLYCFRKHLQGEASVFEQLSIVSSVFTWLTLVPPAHFNGYLEGWPFVLFFVYHYFFFFNVSVRKRLYGDYSIREHDPKWDISTPKWQQALFSIGVMVGHWLAAFEGPELHRIPGGWSNVGIWILILVSLLMQYNSTLYLAKYSEKVVVPTAVVQFGPYRWVRHPIYASTMLLFVTYCVALRAPLSSLFVVAVCLLYYDQKAKLEEALMVENFGEMYEEYATKVKHKFIPFVY